MKWLLLEGRSESGPYSLDQLRQLAVEGRVTPQSELRDVNQNKQPIRAYQILGLFPDFKEPTGSGPVFRKAPGGAVTSHTEHTRAASGNVAQYEQSKQPTASSRFISRLIAAVLLAGLTVGAYTLTRQVLFPPPPPVDLKAEVKARLGELDQRIMRWKAEQRKVEEVSKALEEDREGLLWQCQRLGIYSSTTANDTPRGQTLLQELRSLTDQLTRLRKKQEEYSLAIFQSESKLRTIERSLATSQVLANEAEISELFNAVSAADTALAAETGSSSDVEVDQKLNTLLADLADDEVSNLEWGPGATVILLDLQPRDLAVSCFEQPGVKIEGSGRYRRVLVPESLFGREMQFDFVHPKYQSAQSKVTLKKGDRETLSIELKPR